MTEFRDEVSPAYLEWLRLVALGGEDDAMADELGVPIESLSAFARVAAQKLLRAAKQEGEE